MRKRWTEKEELFLSDNYKIKSNKEIGEEINKTSRNVYDKCRRMYLKRTKNEKSRLISNGMKKFFNTTNRKWNRKRTNQEYVYSKRKERILLLEKFGGKCINCDINDFDVLHFDHIDNDGHKYTNKNIRNQIEENPEKFQILCANCNTKKEIIRRELDRLERLNIPPF